jgi:hypothetical protein
MWISRRRGHRAEPTPCARALEALGLAAALALLPELAGARTGIFLEPHPGWIAVIVLAARYGGSGLFAGLIASAGAVAIGSVITGTGIVTSWSRFDSGPNLIAFGVCLAVSWIASWHLRRQEDLCERLRVRSARASEAEATVATLQEVVATLRARVDRTSTSLAFLRDVAARLEGTDPVAAAEGAADLACARTGAGAVAVLGSSGGLRRVLAVRDARGPMALAPLALHDADLTVPIRNGNDRIGVLALWGIPRSASDAATANDLALIASWCAPALGIATSRREEPSSRALGVT